jgi:hypothetical protein
MPVVPAPRGRPGNQRRSIALARRNYVQFLSHLGASSYMQKNNDDTCTAREGLLATFLTTVTLELPNLRTRTADTSLLR